MAMTEMNYMSGGGGEISGAYYGAASASTSHTITYADGVDEVYIFASTSSIISVYTALTSVGRVEKGSSVSVAPDSATVSLSADGTTLTLSRSGTSNYFAFIGIKK